MTEDEGWIEIANDVIKNYAERHLGAPDVVYPPDIFLLCHGPKWAKDMVYGNRKVVAWCGPLPRAPAEYLGQRAWAAHVFTELAILGD